MPEELGLPLLRGNPFDLRPIESGRAEYLVGRDRLISSWREHIVSQSPRMMLLVGETGSGRSSIVRTLASQTKRSFVGQFWPMKDPVNSIIHELSIHFCGFESSGSNQKMIDDLVTNLEESSGNLPVVSLDYPSNVDLAPVLCSLSPILQRLRALVIVVLTPSQLSTLDEETTELYDVPEYIPNLTKSQIQDLSNRLVSKKAREKWIIDDALLSRIHESTSGNPRDVIRLLRDLTDERRDVGAKGTLERLMRWQKSTIGIRDASDAIGASQKIVAEDEEKTRHDSIGEESEYISSPQHLQERPSPVDEADEKSDVDDFSNESDILDVTNKQDDLFKEPSDLWIQDTEESENNEKSRNEMGRETVLEQGTLDDFVYMEPGSEPPMFNSGNGFKGLASRSRVAQNSQPNSEEGAPFIESISEVPSLWPDKETEYPENVEAQDGIFLDDSYDGDNAIKNPKSTPSSVMSTDSAHWSVEPSMKYSLPRLEDKKLEASLFGIDDSPTGEIYNLPVPKIDMSMDAYEGINAWEPDQPLDEIRKTLLNEAELLVISVAAKREISPSDAELQARLEVGRPRLSQIYNGLHKSGFLSVRKQGRKRLFKITEAAKKLVEA
tara:strand:+ start:35156 stop:36985 length:1830 start_codon:yes stop_codon:yes gene_type:complete